MVSYLLRPFCRTWNSLLHQRPIPIGLFVVVGALASSFLHAPRDWGFMEPLQHDAHFESSLHGFCHNIARTCLLWEDENICAPVLNASASVGGPSIALSDLLAGFAATTRQDGETIGCTVQRASCLGQ